MKDFNNQKGLEVSGVAVAVGSKVENIRTGDNVNVSQCFDLSGDGVGEFWWRCPICQE